MTIIEHSAAAIGREWTAEDHERLARQVADLEQANRMARDVAEQARAHAPRVGDVVNMGKYVVRVTKVSPEPKIYAEVTGGPVTWTWTGVLDDWRALVEESIL